MSFYTKKTWINGSDPAISAANLQIIDDQIETISNTQYPLNSGLICAPQASVPEWPDNAAGTTYFQDAWATVDGWTAATIPTVSGGKLIFAKTAANQYIGKTGITSFPSGTTIKVKCRIASGAPDIAELRATTVSASETAKPMAIDGTWSIVNFTTTGVLTNMNLYAGTYSSANTYTLEIDWIYIGDGTYTSLALDASGNGNHGTVYGATPVDTVAGRGLSFDGVNDYATAPYTLSAGNFSASIWFKVTSLPAVEGHFFDLGGQFGQMYINNTGVVRVGDIVNVFTPTISTWYSLVAIKSGTTLYVYINGVLAGTKTSTNFVSYSLASFGRYYSGSSYHFTGSISDPRIYNRALTAEEVWELYAKPGMSRMSGPVDSVTAVPNSRVMRDANGKLPDYWRSSSGVGGDDGNGGQPPAPKPIGWDAPLSAIGGFAYQNIASGANCTLPGSTGQCLWFCTAYNVGLSTPGSALGVANCNANLGPATGNTMVISWRIL